MKKSVTVSCPICTTPVEWKPENCFRPFCSERCRLIDLGEWANEGYRIPDSGNPKTETDAPTSED